MSLSKGALVLILACVLAGGVLVGTLLVHPGGEGGEPRAPVAAQQAPQALPQQAPQAGAGSAVPAGQPAIAPAVQARIDELSRAVAANPGDRRAFVELGNLYFDTHQAPLSIRAYEAALKLEGNDPDVLTDLGIMYRHERDYEKALECFRKAAALSPRHRNARFNQGVVLAYDLGRPQEAVAIWKELLALHPDARTADGTPLANLVAELEGRPAPAPAAAAAPAPKPGPGAIPGNTGFSADAASTQRILELARTTAADPGNRAAFVELGNLYFDTNQPSLAIQAYEAALRLRGDDPDVLTDLGIMYRATNRPDQALATFRKASALDPGHRNALFNEGVVLAFDLGRGKEAVAAWDRVLALYPDARTPDGRPLSELANRYR